MMRIKMFEQLNEARAPELKITLEEAIHLMKKPEYTYRKKGSPFIDKVKAFIEENQPK